MPYDPEKHRRRSIRVKGYDYASPGGYFITICVQHSVCLFGEVIDGIMHLSDAGRMVDATWASLPEQFKHLQLDVYQVMPNHMHGILVLLDDWSRYDGTYPGQGTLGGEPRVHPASQDQSSRPTGTASGSVGRIIQVFKTMTTNAYIEGVRQQRWAPFPLKLWQRSYWDRIIRDGRELERIQQYITDNPLRWQYDRLNPDREM